MCETKRVAWRPEVPEHAQIGSIGDIKGQFWILRVPDHPGTDKNDLEENFF